MFLNKKLLSLRLLNKLVLIVDDNEAINNYRDLNSFKIVIVLFPDCSITYLLILLTNTFSS